MPFKTKNGTHYHMTEGCCGATISCDTAGLEPCSICCGGTSGTTGGGTAVGTSNQSGGGFHAGMGEPAIPDEGYGVVGEGVPNPASEMTQDPSGDDIWTADQGSDSLVMVKMDDDGNVVAVELVEYGDDDFISYTIPDFDFGADATGVTDSEPGPDANGMQATAQSAQHQQPRQQDSRQQQPQQQPRQQDSRQQQPQQQPRQQDSQQRQSQQQPRQRGSRRQNSPQRRQHVDASADLRTEIIRTMIESLGSPQVFMRYPERVVRATVSHYADRIRDAVSQPAPSYDSQISASTILSSPQSAQAAIAMANQTVSRGLRKNVMPTIRRIGKGFKSTFGRLQLTMSDRAHFQRTERMVRRAMRQNECDEYSARCMVAASREAKLDRAQRSAAEYIRYQMKWSNAGDPNRRVTYGDVVCNRLRSISEDTARGYGMSDTDWCSVNQTIALSRSIQRAFEESGYADKITPRLIERMRQERGLSPDENDAMTMAMESAMRASQFRTGRARQVTMSVGRARMNGSAEWAV